MIHYVRGREPSWQIGRGIPIGGFCSPGGGGGVITRPLTLQLAFQEGTTYTPSSTKPLGEGISLTEMQA